MKTSSLGDVVHHCPAVSDAARCFPGAAIDWVVEEAFAAVPGMHDAVRRVIPVAIRRWRGALFHPSMWREMGAFRRALGAERYDAVIDTQSLLKSALVARAAHGPKHGMDRASAREPIAARLYERTYAVPRGVHAVERNRRLAAAALGYQLEGPCDYGLRRERGSDDNAVFLTMTSRADKLWPEERWIELGRSLGRSVLLPWGSEAERARAERIAAGIGSATVLERMPLDALKAHLGRASLVVGLDTGLTHLAAALGAPTVGIYCGSDPLLTGLYGAAQAVNVGGLARAPDVAEVLHALK